MWRNRADNKSGGRVRHTHHKPPTQGLIFSGILFEFRRLHFHTHTHTHTHTHRLPLLKSHFKCVLLTDPILCEDTFFPSSILRKDDIYTAAQFITVSASGRCDTLPFSSRETTKRDSDLRRVTCSTVSSSFGADDTLSEHHLRVQWKLRSCCHVCTFSKKKKKVHYYYNFITEIIFV